MIQAILAGRKVQTRRVMKPQPEPCGDGRHWWRCKADRMMIGVEDELQATPGMPGSFCPYGAVGDRLWVRETWGLPSWEVDEYGECWGVDDWSGPVPKSPPALRKPVFAADGNWSGESVEDRGFRWRPSIHMPRWASRLMLEITEVRIEAVQAISEEDAMAEGARCWLNGLDGRSYDDAEKSACRFTKLIDPAADAMSSRGVFAALWESINGEGAWKRNDYVWALTFRRIEEGGGCRSTQPPCPAPSGSPPSE